MVMIIGTVKQGIVMEIACVCDPMIIALICAAQQHRVTPHLIVGFQTESDGPYAKKTKMGARYWILINVRFRNVIVVGPYPQTDCHAFQKIAAPTVAVILTMASAKAPVNPIRTVSGHIPKHAHAHKNNRKK